MGPRALLASLSRLPGGPAFNPPVAMPIDEGKLRTELKKVFEMFDEDASGSISSDELGKICKKLNMEMDKAALKKMMTDADPDGSGSIDFEEFVKACKQQIEQGHGGGLGSLVEQAGGFFGFFGSLFGFGGGEPAPPPPKPAAAPAPKPTGGFASPKPVAPSVAPAPAYGGGAPAPPPAYPPAASSASPPAASAMGGSPPSGGGGGGGGFFDGAGAAGQSLYDQYMSPGEAHANRKLGHGETRTTRLRATGVKLSCYLNTEVDRGRATVISLPEDCDTLGEVLPKIQQQMQLDRRMCYAAELYLPNGEKIGTYKGLIDAAALDTAIIVGCGEPFDPSSIPYDLLEFHLQGGGRAAAKKVKKQLADKRKDEANEKADTVRQSGHGLDSRAAITSRTQTQEENREQANMQRQEYMEQLMYRAAQQKSLMDRVHQNNMMHKIEQDEMRTKREEFERVRLETLAEQRRYDKEMAEIKKAEVQGKIATMHNKVKNDFENSGFYKKSKRLANISRSGSGKGVKV